MSSPYRYLDRTYELTISDASESLIIRNLDLKAKVKKTAGAKPNEAEISIFNLKPEHKQFVQRKNLKVELSAGFGENIGLIFRGSTEFTPGQKEDLDWITTLNARDGAINYRGLNISRSYKKGTPVEKVIRDFIQDLKLPAEVQDGLDRINELTEGTIELQKLQLRYSKLNQAQSHGKRATKQISWEEFHASEMAKAGARSATADQVKLIKGRAFYGAKVDQMDESCSIFGLKWGITDQTTHIMPLGMLGFLA